MKIGILTVYFADYGSYFHATSLYKYLESKGHDCELIHESLRYNDSKALAISSIFEKIAPNFLKKFAGERVTALNTYMLLKKDLNNYKISPKCKCAKDVEKRYNCIVVGSDELWSSTNKTIRYIPDYFGLDITVPHISYSTSGITMEFPNEMEADIKKGLLTFEELFVRDKITADWVEKLIGKKPEVVLDPALLYPYYKAEKKDVTDCKAEKYIIVYGEHFSDEQIAWIQGYARYRDIRLCSVAWKHSWCDNHIDVDTAEELQNAFAKAVHCMSSTFHGTIFAIVNEVPFTSFYSKLRGKKVELLLEDLDLLQCLYKDGSDEKADVIIDWERLNIRLEEKRVKSKLWLDEALKSVEEGGK